MIEVNNVVKKHKDFDYYNKKLSNYLKLINSNIELNDEEKEMIKNKLKKLDERMNSILKAEKLNIDTINKNKEKILKEKQFNQYKSYLTNMNIYFDIKENNKEVPEAFTFIYEVFCFVDKMFKLNKLPISRIEKITIDDFKVSDDFIAFIEYYNKHHNGPSLFDYFLE